jgi:hypothetical protein
MARHRWAGRASWTSGQPDSSEHMNDEPFGGTARQNVGPTPRAAAFACPWNATGYTASRALREEERIDSELFAPRRVA